MEELKNLVSEFETQYDKFNQGTMVAGTRARVKAQEVIKLLKDFRVEILTKSKELKASK